MTDAPLWIPDPDRVERTNLTRFRRFVNERHGLALADYDALWAWSIEAIEPFWEDVLDFTGVRLSRRHDRVLASADMPGARWFEGARLNFAENLLRWDGDREALVSVDETGARASLTFAELRQQAARFARFLESRGVQPGDRVAAFMPNRIETVVAMLGAASLGAVFSSCSPDFGFQGVIDRFGQIAPKILVACDGTRYAGRTFSTVDRVAQVARHIPSIEQVVVVPVLGEDPSPIPAAVTWDEALGDTPAELTFAQLPFDHPLYVMYSSGTTGAPKCIVHGAGGTLLQHAKEHVLHGDLRRDDVLFYYTTCGWMMWNWLVSGLFVGSTVLLYDGSPAWPDVGVLFRLAEEEGITHFGTSPKFLGTVQKAGWAPGQRHDLSRVRVVLSTGSPLSAELFEWVYEAVGDDIQLASICGGTDIISCFMLGCPTEPVYAGEIQRRGLGMAVEAWDEQGRPVVGQKGELVCTRPFVSMPVGFWNDPDGRRYRETYFARYPGVWHHGDFVEITPRGGVIVYGRSDATLNPGGVRIGTAEIYRVVEALDEVVEALVVGQPYRDDVRVLLFVVLREGLTLDEALERRIKQEIRRQATPRHVPALVLQVPAVPRTISGKKVELAVTRLLMGEEVTNRDALANPEALDHYARLAASLT